MTRLTQWFKYYLQHHCKHLSSILKSGDTVLLVSGLLLLVFGILILSSASIYFSDSKFGDSFKLLSKQFIFIIIGLILLYLISYFDLDKLYYYRGHLFVVSILLLVLVLIVGKEYGQAQRWFSIFGFSFQPVEFVKFATIIFVAAYLSKHIDDVQETFTAISRLFIPFGIMGLLITLQPDYGSFFLIMIIIGTLIFISGARFVYFIAMLLPMAAVLAILLFTSNYRIARIQSFLDPWQDPYGGGYQIIQSLIAIAQGGFWGKGFGNSVQKIQFLPDAHTDFVFAIFVEEFGLLGVIVLLMLYLVFIARIFNVATKCYSLFLSLVCYGIALWFSLQVIIHIGVNVGILPTKGLTLPFISYGGTSLVMMITAFAVVFNISVYNQRYK